MSEWCELPAGLKYLFVSPKDIGKQTPACRIRMGDKVFSAREVNWIGESTLRECRAAEAGARIAIVTTEPVRYKP